jgi:hypothetical protein
MAQSAVIVKEWKKNQFPAVKCWVAVHGEKRIRLSSQLLHESLLQSQTPLPNQVNRAVCKLPEKYCC